MTRRRNPIARASALFGLASVVACALSCTSTDSAKGPGTSAGGAAGAAGGAGVAGAGGGGGSGGIPFADAQPPTQCPWPVVAGDAGSGGDKPCDGSLQNDPQCPKDVPAAGSACAGSLVCQYDAAPGWIVRSHCDSGTWSEVVHQCLEDCASLDAGAGVFVPGSCGDSDVSCGAESTANLTDLEQLRFALAKIASCCGASSELVLSVTFAGGCGTALSVGPTGANPNIAKCVASSLAGKRINCALDQACAVVVMTTLK